MLQTTTTIPTKTTSMRTFAATGILPVWLHHRQSACRKDSQLAHLLWVLNETTTPVPAFDSTIILFYTMSAFNGKKKTTNQMNKKSHEL